MSAKLEKTKTRGLYRRGKSWVVVFRAGGRQQWRSFKTRSEAELYLAQSRVEVARDTFRAPTKIRFADFAVEWLRDYARGSVGAKTYEGYEGVLRLHLVPEFGERLLTEISRKAIDAFVADWAAGGPRYPGRVQRVRELERRKALEERRDPRPVRLGRSAKTIANALVPLREMLGHAVEWGYLAANPAVGVKRPRAEHREMHFLAGAEVGKLLAAAGEEWGTLLLCAVTTGMRRGELVGLRWGDVDWNSRRLWVRRSVGLRGAIQQPKSRGSVRAVAMAPTLVSALRRHRLASPFSEEGDPIFASERGTPLDGGNMVRRALVPALRRAGLPQIRFHDLRHTFASLLIAQGEHPKYISEQLGHASVQITLDRYGHLMPQSYDQAGDRLEAALFGPERTAVKQLATY
jgi:integrase